MKILLISDTHEIHKRLVKEEYLDNIDMIIHCGDITSSKRNNKEETLTFLKWFHNIRVENKILVPGNHDFYLEELFITDKIKSLKEEFPSINILIDEEITVNNIKFYGTPWTLKFKNFAFMKTEEELAIIYKNIPKDINILVSHGPAYGILDLTYFQNRVGSKSLLEIIAMLKELNYHLFGHIHEEYGILEKEEYTAINCALFTDYGDFNKPIIINL